MKIITLPTGNAPDYYTFNGETVTAHKNGQSESFDLSAIQHGDHFQGVEPDTLDMNGAHIMRNVVRDESGEIHLNICQQVGPGHWLTGSEIDVSEYNKDQIHVAYNSEKSHAGNAWVITARGKVWVR